MQSRDGGWGAFDADNTRTLPNEAAVLRLRRGHRPAVGRRHRARRRDARGRGRGRTRPCPARRSRGCSRARSRTARGSAAGVPTTSTAPAPSSRRWSPPGGRRRRRRSGAPSLARRPPEPRRWLGRGPPLVRRPGVGRPRRLDRLADRLGAARAARRRRGRGPAVRRGASTHGSCDTQRATAAGTRTSTPAPAFPATSTSTTTSTGSSSRSAALGRYVRRSPSMTGAVTYAAWPEWLALHGRARRRRRRTHRHGPRRSSARPRACTVRAAVLVAGVAGGLGPIVRPGDVVVATEVRGPTATRSRARPRRCSPVRCGGSGSRPPSADRDPGRRSSTRRRPR